MASMDTLYILMHLRMFRQGRTGPLVVLHLELGQPVRRSSGLEQQSR